MLDFVQTWCPACGEPVDLAVDTSAGTQAYVEDCPVCCRPMTVRVQVDGDGFPTVEVAREEGE